MTKKIYPHSKDKDTIYLKSIISNPNIIVGDYIMYNDFIREPTDFEKTMYCTNIQSIMINC